MTADDLLAMKDDGQRHELVQGELHTMTRPGMNHGRLSSVLSFHLMRYAMGHGGSVVVDAGFVLERDPDTVRAPDVAYIPPDHSRQSISPKHGQSAPLIAVEINSPSDSAGDVAAKARWWLKHGVRQVWVVDPPSQTVTVYFPDGNARVWGNGETLTANTDLPGFTLDIDPLFNP